VISHAVGSLGSIDSDGEHGVQQGWQIMKAAAIQATAGTPMSYVTI
jgi:hypothetical protein